MNIRIIFYLCVLLQCSVFNAGFAAGTMVKVPGGYRLIEDIRPGDVVYSVTSSGNAELNRVQHITRYFLHQGIGIILEDDFIIAAAQQKFYIPELYDWQKSKKLRSDQMLLSGTKKKIALENVIRFNQEIEFFDIRLDSTHTFCVSSYDIVVHNFPLLFVGFSIAWGAGAISFEGVYFGICIAGLWFSTRLLKGGDDYSGRKKFKVVPSISYGGSPDPDDDWQKKHPHGRYVESEKHHLNARGRVSKPPRDGQSALDNSWEVLDKDYRIAVQDGKIIQLMKQRAGEYHGFIVEEWHTLSGEARKALVRNGYKINPKTGKIKK